MVNWMVRSVKYFVTNRVSEVYVSSTREQLHYVGTHENPADYAIRGPVTNAAERIYIMVARKLSHRMLSTCQKEVENYEGSELTANGTNYIELYRHSKV